MPEKTIEPRPEPTRFPAEIGNPVDIWDVAWIASLIVGWAIGVLIGMWVK